MKAYMHLYWRIYAFVKTVRRGWTPVTCKGMEMMGMTGDRGEKTPSSPLISLSLFVWGTPAVGGQGREIAGRPLHRVGDDRLGKTFDARRRHELQHDTLVELSAKRLGDEYVHLVEARQCLDARGEIDGAAQERELLPLARAHHSREAHAAMDAD